MLINAVGREIETIESEIKKTHVKKNGEESDRVIKSFQFLM